MNLYEFQLPDKSNDGSIDYFDARDEFLFVVLDLAGGMSDRGEIKGYWKDDRGLISYDVMHVVHIACDESAAAELRSLFFTLFPDQKALFCAVIGEAQVFTRDKAAA